MSKIIFVSNHSELAAQDLDVFRAKPLDRDQDGQKIDENNDSEQVLEAIESRRALDIEQAIRCLRISPDGAMLACGDFYGNIRIHSISGDKMDEVQCIEAHENEVLSLDFSTHF